MALYLAALDHGDEWCKGTAVWSSVKILYAQKVSSSSIRSLVDEIREVRKIYHVPFRATV